MKKGVATYITFIISCKLLPTIMLQPQPWARDQGKGLQRCGPRAKSENHISCS
jgi:hypothetical protein